MKRLVSSWRETLQVQHLRALGVLSAGLLLAECNVLSSRHYVRFDASAGQLYTLSDATLSVLSDLETPTEVTVLLGSEDPLLVDLRHILAAYQAETRHLRVRYLDPDRDVVEFHALEQKHDIGGETNEQGATIADTAVVVSNEQRSWYIRSPSLAEFDEEGRLRLRLEAKLTEGLAHLRDSEVVSVCFTTGHGELSIDDTAPEGLVELRGRLSRSNIEVRRVPLDVPDPAAALAACDAIFVVAPDRPWPASHAQALQKRFRAGSHLALFLDPIVDSEGTISESGLGALLETLGLKETPSFILERSPEHRLPTGMGEVFFAEAKTHPATRGLTTDSSRTDARVIAAFAQPFEKLASSTVSPILQTSSEAILLGSLSSTEETSESGTHTLAFAGSSARPDGSPQRWIVVGTSNILENTSYRDPIFFGNQQFSESTFSWLLERPELVSVPERPPLDAGLQLTEESLGELLRYVLIYMPLSAACTGALVLYRRRKNEDESHPGGEARSV